VHHRHDRQTSDSQKRRRGDEDHVRLVLGDHPLQAAEAADVIILWPGSHSGCGHFRRHENIEALDLRLLAQKRHEAVEKLAISAADGAASECEQRDFHRRTS
jgi:hypothetical protein